MTSTDIARQADQAAANYQPDIAAPAAVQEWRMICEQAEILAKAGDMIPRAYQNKPAAIIAAALAGRSLGLDVMAAMRMGFTINGGYTLSSEAIGAVIRRAGHRLDIKRVTDTEVHVTGTRADNGDTYTARWDQPRAVRMKLWAKWEGLGTTEYMLAHRGITEVGRFLFPDLLFGMADDEPVTVPPEPPTTPVQPPRGELGADTATVVVEAVPAAADVNLFGEPAAPPDTTPEWDRWGRDEWAAYIKASPIGGLPALTREWKIRNFDDLAHADHAVRAAIYDAAGPSVNRDEWTFNVAVGFWRSRKSLAVGRDGRDVFLCACAWTSDKKLDGYVPAGALPIIAAEVGISLAAAKKAVAKLEGEVMFEPADGGWTIHNYTEWNPTAEERERKRASNAARQTQHRKRNALRNGESNGGGNDVSHAVSNYGRESESEYLSSSSEKSSSSDWGSRGDDDDRFASDALTELGHRKHHRALTAAKVTGDPTRHENACVANALTEHTDTAKAWRHGHPDGTIDQVIAYIDPSFAPFSTNGHSPPPTRFECDACGWQGTGDSCPVDHGHGHGA